MRYFITLSYNGTNYSGWQTQPSAVTVQETIERALGVILRSPTPIPIVGAGRTDAGVHARAMVAHVDLPLELEEAKDLVFRADRFLPKDIALHCIRPVREEAHARFSATARTYRYYLTLRKNPFVEDLMLRLHFPLDFGAMNEAANYTLMLRPTIAVSPRPIGREGQRRELGPSPLPQTASYATWYGRSSAPYFR